MDVSVLVVSWNTRELLRRCLESVDATAEGLAVEVVVVDNGSTDGSAELVAEAYPQVRLIRNSGNRGFAAANNQALAVSRGRYALLLNSDARLLDGALRRLVGYLDARPEVAVAGGRLLNPDGTFQGSFGDFPTLGSELLLLTGLARLVCPPTYPCYPAARGREARPVDWVSGACLMARRAAIADVGPLDEAFFMYSEEIDWCCRMRRAGWQVAYVPDAAAVHSGGQSSDRAPERKRAQLYRSKELFLRRHRGRLTAATFHAAVRAASALKLLAWAASGLAPSPERRERAASHVRSYRALLGEW